tara:strand:- start:2092 stop:2361 length:270 start_codon:yes stop_codon:yes gene_type:complete
MSKNKLIYKDDGTVDYRWENTKNNTSLSSLEEIISIVSERAIEVIDDSLYELIGKDEDNPDEFYEDYMECLPHILKNISEFQNKINEED